MKLNLLLLAFTALSISIQAQTTVQWSDSIEVTATPYPITAPRVALLPDGTPLVTWGRSGNNIASQIWCSRFEGGAFSAAVGVAQSPYAPNLFGFGGYEVALSDSLIFVVFEQVQHGILLARSEDGGLTFSAPTVVQGPVSGGYATISSVVVDGTGNPVVSYIREKNGTTYQVRRSSDGGISFLDPVTANAPAPGGAVCECCASDLLASGDSMWIVFRNNNQNLRDIWVSRSTDLSTTFDVATDVDSTDWNLNTCPIAGPRMARSGDSILTIWMSQASGIPRVYLSTLHAGTMEMGQHRSFPSPPGPPIVQGIADIVAVGDTVGVVFLEKNKEIVFYASTHGVTGLPDQGARFALPNHTLQYPSLAFGEGVFHLVYADATADKVLYRQGTLTQSSPTAEPSEVAELDISVFPNPALHAEGFWVKSETGDLLEIFMLDVFGKKMLEQKTFGREAFIPTGNFPKGIYFLKVKTGGGELWREVVVQ